MITRLFRLLCISSLVFSPCIAYAHHGQDFLLLESPTVGDPGNVYFIADAHLALDSDAEEEAGFEPALFVGVFPRVAFELHAHTEKLAGEGWSYEATAPSVLVLLTDPAKELGWKVGFGTEYEFSAEDAAPDHAAIRLSFENVSASAKWGGNLIAEREQGSATEFAVALGFRHLIHTGLAFGIEGSSNIEHISGAELLLGAYYEHANAWALKFGLGGVREESGHTTPSARLGLVVRLKE